MRVFVIVLFTMSACATVGCGAETQSTSSPTVTSPAPTTASTAVTPSTTTEPSTSTTTAPSSTTTAPSSTTTSTTTAPTSTTTTTAEPVEQTVETVAGYGEWEPFWSAFSRAAATGDVSTVDALTADELSLVYAGGSVSSRTAPKAEFLGSFARPQGIFEQGRRALDDGTVFQAELRAPGPWSTFHQLGIAYDIAYSVFLEAGDGGPASASEYIFRKVDGTFLFVGYSLDS